MAREVITGSSEETRALGRTFGSTLEAGAVVLLEGDLGAGKTTFAKGVAEACGVTAMVKSPTFALMHRYRGKPDLVHIDLFRQGPDASLEDLALEEAEARAITLVEWPRGEAEDRWPNALRILFEHVDEGRRRIHLP